MNYCSRLDRQDYDFHAPRYRQKVCSCDRAFCSGRCWPRRPGSSFSCSPFCMTRNRLYGSTTRMSQNKSVRYQPQTRAPTTNTTAARYSITFNNATCCSQSDKIPMTIPEAGQELASMNSTTLPMAHTASALSFSIGPCSRYTWALDFRPLAFSIALRSAPETATPCSFNVLACISAVR